MRVDLVISSAVVLARHFNGANRSLEPELRISARRRHFYEAGYIDRSIKRRWEFPDGR